MVPLRPRSEGPNHNGAHHPQHVHQDKGNDLVPLLPFSFVNCGSFLTSSFGTTDTTSGFRDLLQSPQNLSEHSFGASTVCSVSRLNKSSSTEKPLALMPPPKEKNINKWWGGEGMPLPTTTRSELLGVLDPLALGGLHAQIRQALHLPSSRGCEIRGSGRWLGLVADFFLGPPGSRPFWTPPNTPGRGVVSTKGSGSQGSRLRSDQTIRTKAYQRCSPRGTSILAFLLKGTKKCSKGSAFDTCASCM